MKTILRPLVSSLAILIFLANLSSAYAAVVSFANRAAFDAAFPGSVYENWEAYASGTVFPDGSTVNGITYNSSAGNAFVTNLFLSSTTPNGLGDTAAGFFNTLDSIIFGFSQPLFAFGIDLNTFAATPAAYTATTSNGDVALSVFDPFPGLSTGQFVGFVSDLPFVSVTIAAGANSEAFTLDTLRAVAVPEPESIALLMLGLIGMGIMRRFSQRGSA